MTESFKCAEQLKFNINIRCEEGVAPLARTISMSSCAGYHTPIEDEVAIDGINDFPSDLAQTSRGGSMLSTQVDEISPDKKSIPFIPFNDFRYHHQVLLS